MRSTTIRTLRMAAVAFALVACDAGRIVAPLSTAAPLTATTDEAGTISGPAVVISQVYGGGGNSGATWKNDFIELFNRTAQPVSVAGWSVQYASATGSSWGVTNLTGTIPAGGYYLVQEAAGSGGTTALPTPDATGSSSMAAGAGKVILVSNTTAATGTCPTASVLDAVSFGTTATACGTAKTTATIGNTTAALRGDAGCTWTGDLSADFAAGAPTPRNTASATHACTLTTVPPVATVTMSPAMAGLNVGGSQQFTATALDASNAAIPNTTFTWTTSDATIASVSTTGLATALKAGTATITATSANGKSASASVTVASSSIIVPDIRLSELHYDNTGTDQGEAIEIEGPAGTTLTGWSLVLYNGSSVTDSITKVVTPAGSVYSTTAVSGTLAQGSARAACNGRGVLVFTYPTNGIQNGGGSTGPAADGVALVDNTGKVVEFLSYEGAFQAADGPAAGTTSTDIGVAEPGTDKAGLSLHRSADGSSWSAPSANDFGYVNACGGPVAPPPAAITFSGRDPVADPALPVGFEAQVFATETGVSGATFTWTSETPAIASVDNNGVFHALSTGTAVLRATAGDGTSATISYPIADGVQGTAPYAGNTEFGEPTDADASDDYIVHHDEYTLSYSKTRNTPNWVSYRIDATNFGSNVDRCNCFTMDPLLPSSFTHLTTADYTGAGAAAGYGIDRGHMARSADRTAGTLDNARTYYLSNVIPQAADLNQGPWAQMENYLGDQAKAGKEVYVIDGPAGNKGTVKNEGKIVIPTYAWKVAVIMDHAKGLADVHAPTDLQVIAVAAPNVAGVKSVDWHTWVVSVDSVQRLSGYDFLAALPDNIECTVEQRDCGAVTTTGDNVSVFPTDPATNTQPVAITFGTVTSAGGTTTLTSSTTAPAATPAITGLFTVSTSTLYYDISTTTAFTGTAKVCVSYAPEQYTGTQQPALLHYDNGTWVDVTTSVDAATHHVCGDVTHFSPFAVVRRDQAPTAAIAASATTANEGGAITFIGSGVDPDGDAISYAWTFGDGTTASTATAAHTFADNGTYTVTLVTRDALGATGTATTTVTVANLNPTASFSASTTALNEGDSFTLSLDNAADVAADAGTLTYAFDCGTGFGAATSSPTASCAASDNGALAVRGKVIDKDGGFTIYDAAITVANVAPTAVLGAPASVVEGSAFSLTAGSIVEPSSADRAALTFAFDCGDGRGLGAPSSASTVSCPTSDNGTRTVKLVIADKDGGTNSYTGTVSITNANPTGRLAASSASVVEGSSFTMTLAELADASPVDLASLKVAFDCGSGAFGAEMAATAGTSVTCATTDDGPRALRALVTDKDGGTVTLTANVAVTNDVPAIAEFAGASIMRGEHYAVNGTFADAGADTWTAVVDYGDGTSAVTSSLVGRTFSLAHDYQVAGTFTVSVTIRDDDGGAATRTAVVQIASPAEAVATLSDNVSSLASSGTISASEANSLSTTLDHAVESLGGTSATLATTTSGSGSAAKDNPSARNQIGAFINKVEALQRSGRLSAATAASLTAYAQRIVASIG